MSSLSFSEFASILNEARLQAKEIKPLIQTYGDFDLSTAYKIQEAGIELRLAAGEKIIGYKMGLTSKAKMQQMNLDRPIYGVLTDKMRIDNRGSFSLKGQIHAKAEPEVFFVTNKVLSGKIDRTEALAAINELGVAIEILDSRFEGFKYFSLPDVVADNGSSSHFVLGASVKQPFNMNCADLEINIQENAQVRFSTKANAILGDPILSLCELVQMLAASGKILPAGSIVLAGAATQAIPLEPGQSISAALEGIGLAQFNVTQ